MRIGHGFDVHAFGPGDHVMLGGVHIPCGFGLIAHSDGDVIIHALCDALLGALALGDIGQHFSPLDARWKDADSGQFLLRVTAMLHERQWRLANADITLLAELPKLSPHRQAMRERLASLMDCAVDRVSVKATTTEKLGFIGRGEGIAAEAVVLIESFA